MTQGEIFEFFRRLAEDDPSPETELEFGNHYQLLVAVVLSAQATDVGVNKATRALFGEVKTPRQMVELGEDGLKQHIKTIGLFNAKAKNVIALSEQLIAEHGGEVPAEREALVKLPGVGRKTANVVLNCAFGEETFAVDTHVFRVSNRTGLAKGKTPEQVEARLEKRVPRPFRRHAHHWLILHGRYTCKARTPECWRCPVNDLCGYRDKVLEKPVARGKRGERLTRSETMKRTILLIAAVLPLAACAAETDSTARISAPAVTVAGEPVDCIQTSRIRNTVVHDDYTIDFVMSGGDVYRNTLPNRCSGLGFEQRFAYEVSTGQICRIELIRVLQPGAGRGPACSLGPFVPVRYVEAG